MNYQLARTNVNLGGQMKWDLILNPVKGNLTIADFHLTPISDYVPYNYQTEEDLLNHTHLENIKKFYNKISKSFFKNVTDPKLTTGYPLQNNGQPMKAFDDTYLCGLKREKYSKYQKQLAYFCPVWIESVDDFEKMRFCINIYKDTPYKDRDGNMQIERITVLKKYINMWSGESEFHNKFIKYVTEYMKACNLNNDLCSLKFQLGESYIKGVNAQYGVPETKDTSYMLNNITERERPLLEFDNMLTTQFSSNKMIAPQLFNFNFCFDVDDLLSTYTDFMGEGFVCEMFVEQKVDKYRYKRLEFKDFFVNYETIKKMSVFDLDSVVDDNLDTGNCLDYLKDYLCYDFIDKNKINPQTCHWSLLDNNDYLFQLYDGFAPVFIKKDGVQINSAHKFFDTPDVWDEDYNFLKNNINWCNIHKDNLQIPDIINIEFTVDEDKYFTKFDLSRTDVIWANSLKYDVSKLKFNFDDDYKDPILKIGIFQTTFLYDEIEKEVGELFVPLDKGNNILYHIDENDKNKIYLLSTNTNNLENINSLNRLTFKGFVKILNENNNSDLPLQLQNLKMVLNNLIKPMFIFLRKSVSPKAINYPPLLSKQPKTADEITYYKNDQYFNYLIRYDGRIRPSFISINNKYKYFNYLYFYKNNNDSEFNEEFNNYTLTKFDPKYPSRNYFSINKIELKDYNVIQDNCNCLYCLKDDDIIEKKIFEWKWFNNNKFLFLHPEIKMTFVEDDFINIDKKADLEKKIKDELMKRYKVSPQKTNYIYNQYNIEYDYEYKNLTNLDDYIYKVTLKLK